MQMFKFNRSFIGIVMILVGCNMNGGEGGEGTVITGEGKTKRVEGSSGGEIFFSMDVPVEMKKMSDLNQAAILQYGNVKKDDLANGKTVVFEHYLLVFMENKKDIIENHADQNLDLSAYLDMVILNFKTLYNDNFEVLEPRFVLEEINGLSAIQTEATLHPKSPNDGVTLFYKIAVFESDRAFYQVITWCLNEQRGTFESKMEQMIASFKEIIPALN